MKLRSRLQGGALLGGMVAVVVLGVGDVPVQALSPGVDGMVLTGTIYDVTPSVALVAGGTSWYQVGATCPTIAPSFADVPSDPNSSALGVCPGMTGNGDYTNVVCGSGVLTGSATLTEPDGESVPVGPYVIALVSGIGGVATLGYGDEGASVGGGGGAALVLPEPIDACESGGATTFSVDLALSAAHD